MGCCGDGVLWGWEDVVGMGCCGSGGVVGMTCCWDGGVVGVGDVVGMGMLWGWGVVGMGCCGGGGVMGLVTHVWSRRAYPRPWRGTRKWLRFKPLRSVVIIALEVKSLPIPRVRAPPVQFAHRVLPCCYHYYYVITCVPQSVSSHVTTPLSAPFSVSPFLFLSLHPFHPPPPPPPLSLFLSILARTSC